jgi:hypothetical protein
LTAASVYQPPARPPSRTWTKSAGTYLAGQSHIDGADHLAAEMEAKWGIGRLRLLVSAELREKFDRQRYKLNQAIWHGDLEAVRVEAGRMCAAWRALDKAAEDAGEASPVGCWAELALSDGTAVAIVANAWDARAVDAAGRQLVVYTLDEIGRLLEHHRAVLEAKRQLPGVTVTAVRKVEDPLDALRDSDKGLDDPLDGELPF